MKKQISVISFMDYGFTSRYLGFEESRIEDVIACEYIACEYGNLSTFSIYNNTEKTHISRYAHAAIGSETYDPI